MVNRRPIVQDPANRTLTTHPPQTRRVYQPLDAQTAYLLTRLYLSRRIDYQQSYYRAKAKEHDNNSDLMFRLGAIIMTLSSLLAAIGATIPEGSRGIALATALLPAFAALIASFRQLYQWERQATLYRDTMLGLEEASLAAPDRDALDPPTALNVLSKLVENAEQVFKNEVDQWGQLTMAGEEEDDEEQLRKFAEQYGFAILDENGNVDQEKLETLRGILAASTSAPEAGIPQIQTLPPQQPTLSASASASAGTPPQNTSPQTDFTVAPDAPTTPTAPVTPPTTGSTPLTPERPLQVGTRQDDSSTQVEGDLTFTEPLPVDAAPVETTDSLYREDLPNPEDRFVNEPAPVTDAVDTSAATGLGDFDDSLIPPAPDDSSRFEFDDAFSDVQNEMFDDTENTNQGGDFEDVNFDDFPEG
ncbi:MAG: hypothetical protein CUN54_03760 [Phototrophicales bacterium]|nr:MAG: hypothetical protein CUN54_03760 [Phototrophicales bacterium]